MIYIDNLYNFIKSSNHTIKNVLILFGDEFEYSDILNISKIVDNLNIVYDNGFSLRKSFNFFKNIKNINVFSCSEIPNENYNLLFFSNFYLMYELIKLPGILNKTNYFMFNDRLSDFIEIPNFMKINDFTLKNVMIKNDLFTENKLIKTNAINENIDIKNIVPRQNEFFHKNILGCHNGVVRFICLINEENDFKKIKNKLKIIENSHINYKTLCLVNNLNLSSNIGMKFDKIVRSDKILNTNDIDILVKILVKDEYLINLNEINDDDLNKIWEIL